MSVPIINKLLSIFVTSQKEEFPKLNIRFNIIKLSQAIASFPVLNHLQNLEYFPKILLLVQDVFHYDKELGMVFLQYILKICMDFHIEDFILIQILPKKPFFKSDFPIDFTIDQFIKTGRPLVDMSEIGELHKKPIFEIYSPLLKEKIPQPFFYPIDSLEYKIAGYVQIQKNSTN